MLSRTTVPLELPMPNIGGEGREGRKDVLYGTQKNSDGIGAFFFLRSYFQWVDDFCHAKRFRRSRFIYFLFFSSRMGGKGVCCFSLV